MQQTPRSLSVVVPAYNAASYLEEALESILTQSHPPDEVLVVDDGSEDNTVSIAARFSAPVQVLQQAKKGPWAARNLAVERAAGSILAFADADDICEYMRFERQLNALSTADSSALVFGHMEEFLDRSRRDLQSTPSATTRVVPGLCPGTMMLTRASFVRCGPFPTQYKAAGFLEWYMHAKEKGVNTIMLNEIVLRRRIHNANSGLFENDSAPSFEYIQVLKGALERSRSKP